MFAFCKFTFSHPLAFAKKKPGCFSQAMAYINLYHKLLQTGAWQTSPTPGHMICLGVQHSTAHTHVVQSKYISHFVMSPFISCFVLYSCIPSMSIGLIVFFKKVFVLLSIQWNSKSIKHLLCLFFYFRLNTASKYSCATWIWINM